MKATYLLSIVLQKWFKICARVLAPYPTPALTQKHVSTRFNTFQVVLQYVTKHNYFFILGKTTFGTHCTICRCRLGCAMPQAIRHRSLTAETGFGARINQCGICGGQSGTGTGLSSSSSVLTCQYNSTAVLHTHVSPGA
jgi:hypothetical protein